MNIVYVEGGSTAFGALDREMGGWPSRLHVTALREATSWEDATMVINRSMPGRTLPGILREAEANMAYYYKFSPVAAVLQTGMNEVKIFPGSHTPIITAKRFGEQVSRFCAIAREQDCAPVLVGPQPIDTSRNNTFFGGTIIKDELLVEYGDIMRGVAERTGAPYVDTRAIFEGSGRPVQELLSEDGCHPNNLGHAALATAVYNALPFNTRK